MTAREYYNSVLQLFTTSRVVVSQRAEFDEQDVQIAYLKGVLSLIDGSTFFFAQYVQIEVLAVVRSTGKSIATIGKRLMGTPATVGIMLDIMPPCPHFRIMFMLGQLRRFRKAAL